MTKIIRPEPNKPITALVVDAEIAPNPNNYPTEQVKLTLQGGKLLYMPAAAARAIAVGHAYTICKKQIKEGMRATWQVQPAEPDPEPVRGRPGDPRLRVDAAYDDGPYSTPDLPPPPYSPLEQKLAESISFVNQRRAAEAAAKEAAEAAARAAQSPAPSRLAAALCAAVDAAAAASKHAKDKYGMDVVFDAEMIKCLGVTAYIQNARSTQ